MVQCDAGSTSRMVDADCGVHLMVEDATAETSSYGTSVKAKFSVLAATDPGQVGKSITEFFQCEGKAVDKLYNLAEAVGIVTPEQRKAAAAQGVGMDIDETAFKGKQLCGQIKMEANMRKNPVTGAYEEDPEKPGPYPRLGFRTFSVHDKKAEGIPKDQQFFALVPKPGKPGEPPAASSPAPNPNPPQPPAGGSGLSMNW